MSLPMLGKYLYTVPVVAFGIFHFTRTDAFAGMVPIPFAQSLWVYLTGACFLLAAVSVYTQKHTVLAMNLLGLLLLLIVHVLVLVWSVSMPPPSLSSSRSPSD